MDSVQKFARVQGYAVSIKFSITGKRVYLKCDRGTLKPQNQQDSRQRQTSSSRADCPFLLSGNYSKRRGNWKLNVLQCSHNHDPSLNPSGHSAHRKLTSDQAEAVKNMTLAGIKPLGILSAIRKTDERALASLFTLYNGRAKVRKDILNGRTPIQALFHELKISEYACFSKCDENGATTSLFFSHQESIRLTCNYHNIALMDCTYTTNSYRLPLLHIVDMTSFNSHFRLFLLP
uniref:FAR1 domain-containing protein n=1 Tax=Hyaloperonospora arabidopsidis (strain Emoy2) TaxID=559515 RepID=M4BCV4_HYAAE